MKDMKNAISSHMLTNIAAQQGLKCAVLKTYIIRHYTYVLSAYVAPKIYITDLCLAI